MKVPSDEVKVCTQPRSRPMAPSPLLGSGDGVLTNTRLRCVQSTWMLVYGRIGRLVRTWMMMRHLALSPGLRHRDGFMPVMTTTPDFRPVLWNTALWQPLLGVYQQTKPRPRRRDLNPGTRPPEVFFLFNPANHSAPSILLVEPRMAEGIPAIQRHEVLAWLSDIRGDTLGPPKGSSAQSITSPVTLSLTGRETWALLAALVEPRAPSVAQPHHDSFGIAGPAWIAATVNAKEDARAIMPDAIDADLLAHSRDHLPYIPSMRPKSRPSHPCPEGRGTFLFQVAAASAGA